MKTKPKTIKIGAGHYDLKTIKEIVDCLPDMGEITITSFAPITRKAGFQTIFDMSLHCHFANHVTRGEFRLKAGDLSYYAVENGKIKPARYITYKQGQETPANTFSLLAVDLTPHMRREPL